MSVQCAAVLLTTLLACAAAADQTATPTGTTPSRKAPINCAALRDGLYLLHPNACTNEFWKCANGRTFMYQCPKPLWFNSETAACDYREKVKACAGAGAAARPISTYGGYGSYQMPSEPVAPVAIQVPEVPTTTAAPVDFDCSNKANGYYFKRPCDSVFYSCAAHIAFQVECPAGTGYDPEDRACEHLSVCGKPKPPTTTTTTQAPINVNVPDLCSNKQDGLYEQGRCQSQYLLCSNGNTYLRECPAQLAFNGEACTYLSDCLNPTTPAPAPVAVENNPYQQVTVPSPPPPPPVAVVPTTTLGYAPPPSPATDAPVPPPPSPPVAVATPPPPSFCRDHNKPDGSYAEGCQNTFYLCSNGQTSVIQCPAGLFYDADTNTCDASRHIVACGGAKPTTVAPPVAVEHPYGAPAQAPVNVEPATPKTPAFDCTGKPEGYYVNGCSAQYFTCFSGQANELNCPSGLNYSPQMQSCDYASNIPECGGQLPTTTAAAATPAVPVNVQSPTTNEAPDLNAVVERAGSSSANSDEEESINHCENLPNGIYGRRCSRHYFVCSSYKTYEFTCPPNYAYDAKQSRCAEKKMMAVCQEATASTPAAPEPAPAPVNVATGPYRHRRH